VGFRVKRTVCAACGSADLDTFLNLGESPIADAYLTNQYDVSPTFPLEVAVCAKCQLVQLLEVVDHETLFGTGYSFYSSASAPLTVYHHHYAHDVINRYDDLIKDHGVLEIGCNDGDFIRHFARFKYRHLGIDPAEGPTNKARLRELDVVTKPFSSSLAVALNQQWGVVIANHVLAHVESVADVLSGIATVLTHGGVAIIEVQYLPDLLVNNAFDLVYHEHRNFFSLSSLEAAAARWDLYVTDAELTDRQGGSLRVTLRREHGSTTRANAIRTSERWLQSFGAYDGMQGRAERIRERLLTLLENERSAGFPVIGYGAPAKATTLFSFCGITRSDITHMTDTTKEKQGRFMPGSGIPILAPHTPIKMPATYLVTAWNYLSQVMRQEMSFTLAAGHWITPFPAPTLL
jgi:SAM-dependent methyltransferase